jgi:hypothetical protein
MEAYPVHSFLHTLNRQRGLLFGAMILTALLAFEVFNFSTTDFALSDLLGDLRFAGVRWAVILAVAFCGIDFAGIARLFTPEQGREEPTEVWYLFGAWLLAATMNAILTWWGVSLAILHHETLGNQIITRDILLRVVPIFVAVMVWLIRVLTIGTFSLAGERLFSQAEANQVADHARAVRFQTPLNRPAALPSQPARPAIAQPVYRINSVPGFRPAPKPSAQPENTRRNEPTYEPVMMQGRGGGSENRRF